MSFLNPVNEPVKRFKSTDAGAPQINYAARTAGDVKAVLKACLVTGYGATASAGWSVVNEADHVAEFVSPINAMSDYRIGIDDANIEKTAWYYNYLDVRTNPNGSVFQNTIARDIPSINKASIKNGWQLLVTARGFLLVEIIAHSKTQDSYCRILYFGQLKAAISDVGENMAFMVFGGTEYTNPYLNFNNDSKSIRHTKIGSRSSFSFESAVSSVYQLPTGISHTSDFNIRSAIYLFAGHEFIGTYPPLLLTEPKALKSTLGATDAIANNRPVLDMSVTLMTDSLGFVDINYRVISSFLDYWEY